MTYLKIKFKKHILVIDLERQAMICGGLLMGMSVLVMSIIIPVLLGGY